MAVNTNFVELTPASELEQKQHPAASDEFLIYDGPELKRSPWSNVLEQVATGSTQITDFDNPPQTGNVWGFMTSSTAPGVTGFPIVTEGLWIAQRVNGVWSRRQVNMPQEGSVIFAAECTVSGRWLSDTTPANDIYDARYVNDPTGQFMEFQYTGNAIEIHGLQSPAGGMAEVYVDGVLNKKINFHGQLNKMTKIALIDGVPYGTHWVRIVPIAETTSGDKLVVLSHFKILNNRGIYIHKQRRHFGIHCGDFGIVGDGKKDETDNINRAIKFLSGDSDTGFHGGQLFFPRGYYKIEGQLKNEPAYPSQYVGAFPIKIIGEGLNSTGMTSGIMRQNVNNLALPGSTVFGMYAETGEAKFLTRPDGNLSLEGITFLNRVGTIPILYSMYTRLSVKECAFIDDHQTAQTDAIVLGGTVWGGGQTYPTNDGFQGYGTIIKDNHFLGVRRAVFGRVTANGVVVSDNSIWMGSGNANGAAIEFNHTDPKAASDPEHRVCGGLISGNLIELMHYKYGISLINAVGVTCSGNNMYDSRPVTVAAYHLGGLSTLNTIIPGFTPSPSTLFGGIKVVKNETTGKNNRVVFGEKITGDVDDFPG